MVLRTPESTVEVTAFTPQYVELTAYFWTDTFAADISLPRLRTVLMERGQTALRAAGFTFSSGVTVAAKPIDVRLLDAT